MHPHLILKALGHKARYAIIDLLLQEGELNVKRIRSKLAKVYKVRISQPALSQHLAVLKKIGLVQWRRDQREVYYDISPHAEVPASSILIYADMAARERPTRNAA